MNKKRDQDQQIKQYMINQIWLKIFVESPYGDIYFDLQCMNVSSKGISERSVTSAGDVVAPAIEVFSIQLHFSFLQRYPQRS